MRTFLVRSARHLAVLLVCAAASITTAHAARRINVATNGVDAPTCGATSDPCRSITQAIRNAVAGDFIYVGPGDYGDIDGDGHLYTPGDEPGGRASNGYLYLINIDKPLTILSTAGAAVTRIDATNRYFQSDGLANYFGVLISSADVEFGRPGQGFSLLGAGRAGLAITLANPRIKIAGNIASGNNAGFEVGGKALYIHHNLAIRNASAGFDILGPSAIVQHNVSQGNGSGFLIGGWTTGAQVSDNVATGNVIGFGLGTIASFDRNSAISNLIAGITASAPVTIRNSNIFGNGTVEPLQACRLRNDSGGTVTATRNYWGSLYGPGDDPADKACNARGGNTTTSSFLTAPVPVATTPFRQ